MMNCFFDLEVYKNYFLCGVMDDQFHYVSFVLDETHNEIDRFLAFYNKQKPRLIGFNSLHYDLPLLKFVMDNYKYEGCLEDLKEISDAIIVPDKAHKATVEVLRDYKRQCWSVPGIDLKEVLGGRIVPSLKKIVARLGFADLESLPIDPAALLTVEQKRQLREYNKIDCKNTLLLYKYCQPQLQLRDNLSKQFGVDCSSKSDARIAETVLAGGIYYQSSFAEGVYPLSQIIKQFSFSSPVIQDLYHTLLNNSIRFERVYNKIKKSHTYRKEFVIDGELTKSLPVATPLPCEYKFGGLHSIHKKIQFGEQAWELDVQSYYPNLIVRYQVAPTSLADQFITKYKSILEKRLQAKKEGRKVEADSLKIVLNSTFGKFNEYYSKLRDPIAGALICLNGELGLLRLMDLCYEQNIDVLLANTDGIVVNRDPTEVMQQWQQELQMPLEMKIINKYIVMDSNNHVLQYHDGSLKIKGAAFHYEKDIGHEADNAIIKESIVKYFLEGIPVAKTIRDCQDIYKFLKFYTAGSTIQQVCVGNQVYRGAIRFYLSTLSNDKITKSNGKIISTVPDTEGIRVLNKIIDVAMPADLNYDLYIDKAENKLAKLLKERKTRCPKKKLTIPAA